MSISKTSLLWIIPVLLVVIICLVFEIIDRDAKIASLEKDNASLKFMNEIHDAANGF